MITNTNNDGTVTLGVARHDTGTIRGKATRTDEGYLRADAVVTRTGVFIYRNPDGTTRRELRHPDDALRADSLETLKMRPMTNEHPPIRLLDSTTAKQYQVGNTGETVHVDEVGKLSNISVSLIVNDAMAIKDIDNGKRQLSCGYICDMVKEDGMFEGEAYDYRQKNIVYNHVALVVNARAGSVAHICLDSADGVEINQEQSTDNNNSAQRSLSMRKVTLDSGIEYDAAPEVVVALEQAKSRIDSAEAKAVEATKAVETITAERDTLKAKCDSLEARDVAKEIATGVASRIELITKAKPFLSTEQLSKLDSMSDSDVRTAVIMAKNADAKLEGKSADYIVARFDSVVELFKDNAIATQRSVAMVPAVGHADSVGADGAHKRMQERAFGAWRGDKSAKCDKCGKDAANCDCGGMKK